MDKFLITGGAGFIGSNFILYMLNKYEDIEVLNLDKLTYAGNLENLKKVGEDKRYTFIRGDICDKELVGKIFQEHSINYVVNFAAETHVDRSITDPDIFIKTNILGTMNLLNNAKEAWTIGDDKYKENVKFIQISTDEVYGSLGEEGLFTEKTPLDPRSPYSASKASADMMVKSYFDTYKFPINITRCSNNYGPYQFPEKLVPLIINNIIKQKDLPIYGDGMQVRDWLYVDDHCKAIDMVARKGRIGEVYNIGGHNEKYNIDIVKLIIKHMEERGKGGKGETLITHVRDRKGHDRRYAIDPEKISSDLDWLPETSFDIGIIKTIDWYLDNQDWIQRVTSGDYQRYYSEMYGDR